MSEETRTKAVELFTSLDSMISEIKNFKRELRTVVNVRKAKTPKSVKKIATKTAAVKSRSKRKVTK